MENKKGNVFIFALRLKFLKWLLFVFKEIVKVYSLNIFEIPSSKGGNKRRPIAFGHSPDCPLSSLVGSQASEREPYETGFVCQVLQVPQDRSSWDHVGLLPLWAAAKRGLRGRLPIICFQINTWGSDCTVTYKHETTQDYRGNSLQNLTSFYESYSFLVGTYW